MRLPLVLLLATFFLIAHAEIYTDYSPPPLASPPPAWTDVPSPPPPPPVWTPVSSPPPPPLVWTDVVSMPPPPPPAWTPVSSPPPPPPVWTPVSSPPPAPPSSPPPPPPRASTPSSPPPPPSPASKPVVCPPPPPEAPWTPVANVNAKEIRQVGQFAVHIYVLKWHVDLVFVKVVSAKTLPCQGGYNYRLVIAVSGPGATSLQHVEAAVWGILGTKNWELHSFKRTK